MDKGFTSFFKFVYKILRFILMLPIKIVKLFCEGFFYTFYVFSEIIFYAILFPSFLVYKIFKYLIYSLSLPVMIANTIKRRKVFKVKKLDKDSEIVHIPDNAMEKIEKYNREHNIENKFDVPNDVEEENEIDDNVPTTMDFDSTDDDLDFDKQNEEFMLPTEQPEEEVPEESNPTSLLEKNDIQPIEEETKDLTSNDYDIEDEKLDKLFSYFKCTIEELDNLDITNNTFIEGKEEIKELFNYLNSLEITECKFTPYLARGLEIYTGTVFEVFDKKQRIMSAIGGGGRYDKIITNFIEDGNTYPAVGISFGIVPICEILKEEVNEALYDVLIVPMNTNIESLKLANSLRKEDIKVLIEMNNRKLKKVFESADKNNVPYVIVLGENEVNEGTIEIKDMKNKTTSKFNINDIEGMKEYINK